MILKTFICNSCNPVEVFNLAVELQKKFEKTVEEIRQQQTLKQK